MQFDILIIGQVCLDNNRDFDGSVYRDFGGGALFSGFAAAAMGERVAVLTKSNPRTVDPVKAFAGSDGVTVFRRDSRESTLMENTFFTADRERRISRCGGMIDPYRPEELPDVPCRVYDFAGLVRGDIGADVILACRGRGLLALDVQCMARRVTEDGSMVLEDWPEKRELLPCIDFLKTDAAEAEILTGLTDRAEAAKALFDWGAREIIITHNTEVLAYDGKSVYTRPLRPRNLSGRSGRGDTAFAGYMAERHREDIPTSLTRAAALVSLKMETPGPFSGTRADVDKYIEEFYGDC